MIKKALKFLKIDKVYYFLAKVTYPIILFFYGVRRNRPTRSGINGNDRGCEVIVSLTSFPERIIYVHKVIYSLMNQTYKADKIILWLAKEQFPKGEESLTQEIRALKKYGLSIEWVNNDIKSYKKLIPAIKKYPESIIVTCDDDLYYPKYWLKQLLESYYTNSDCISCQMITRMCYKNDDLHFEDKCDKYSISYSNKILSGSGTLFPPHSLHEDVSNEIAFCELSPTNDDMWFWAMAVRNNTPIKCVNGMKRLLFVEQVQETTPCLWKNNNYGDNLRRKDAITLIDYYDLKKYIETNVVHSVE